MGHVGSKTRSLDQFFKKLCVHSRRLCLDSVFMKLCQNVCLYNILGGFKTGSCQIRN